MCKLCRFCVPLHDWVDWTRFLTKASNGDKIECRKRAEALKGDNNLFFFGAEFNVSTSIKKFNSQKKNLKLPKKIP
jgi:hypothetical protein